MRLWNVIVCILFIFIFQSAYAVSGSFGFDVVIQKPDSSYLEAASVDFKFSITDDSGTCVIYSEDHLAVDMTGTSGQKSFQVGNILLQTYPNPMVTTLTLDQVFSSSGVVYNCQGGGTYMSTASASRKLILEFNDGSGVQTLPAMAINSVPYAQEARTVVAGSITSQSILDGTITSSDLSSMGASAGQVMKWNGSSWVASSDNAGTGLVNSVAGRIGSVTLSSSDISGLGILAGKNQVELSTDITGVLSFSNLAQSSATTGQVIKWNGSSWVASDDASGLNGTVTSVTSAGAPIVIGGTSSDPTISITQANGTTAGYLSSNDWSLFNAKLSDFSSLTSADITGKLGYTPANSSDMSGYVLKAGDTMTGALGIGITPDATVDLQLNNNRRLRLGTASGSEGMDLVYTNFSGWSLASFNAYRTGYVGSGGYSTMTVSGNKIALASTTQQQNSGSNASVEISTTVNTTGTSSNTDLKILRTEAAVGSGQQNLIDAQVGGVSKFRVDTTGKVYGDGSGLTNLSGVISGLTTGKISKAGSGTTIIDSIITESSNALEVAANSASTGVAVTQSGSGYAATFMGGNVGIGTTTPGAKLQIDTTVGGLDALILRDTTNSANARFYFTSPLGTPADLNISADRVIFPGHSIRLNRIEGLNNDTIGMYGANTSVSTNGDQKFQVGGSGATLFNGGKINSVLTATDNIPGLVIQGSNSNDFLVWQNSTGSKLGAITSSGSLGVGTASPTAKLHLSSSDGTASSAPLKFTAGTNLTTPEAGAVEYDGTNLYFTDSGATRRTLATTSGVSGSYVAKSGDTMTGSLSISGDVSATTATIGTDKFVVTSGGSIGVGTASPVGRFDIFGGTFYVREKGSSTALTTSYDSENFILRGTRWDGSSSINQDFRMYVDGYTGEHALRVEDPASGNGIAIYPSELVLTNGNYRLRSTNTSNPLGLSSTVYGSTAVTIGGGNGPGFVVVDPGAWVANYATVQGGISSGEVTIGTAGSDSNVNLVIAPKGSGNVGIGTSTPSNKLEVNGNIRSSAGQIVGTSFSIATGAIDFNSGNSGTTSFDCANAANEISFANMVDGGSYTLVVTGTGTAQCSFNTTTTGTGAASVTYRFKPSNGTRTGSSHTIYSLQRIGNIVYVSWQSGF